MRISILLGVLFFLSFASMVSIGGPRFLDNKLTTKKQNYCKFFFTVNQTREAILCNPLIRRVVNCHSLFVAFLKPKLNQ